MPVPVAVVVAAVGTEVEVGRPVVVVEAALGRQPWGTSDLRRLEHAARRPSVVLDGTAVVQRAAADAGTPTDKRGRHGEQLERPKNTFFL